MPLRFVLVAFFVSACGSSKTNTPAESTAPVKPDALARTDARTETTPDTKPDAAVGINTRFLNPKLDVGKWVKRFESESREVYAERKNILAAIGLRPGQAVADVGAGTGLFEPLFSRAVGPGGKVYAVEISPRFLEHLRKLAKTERLTNVRVVQGTATSIGLAKQSVDVVFLCDTYHHFGQPMKSLASIHSALRPGGTVVVVDFERIPGKTRKWLLDHVRAGKDVVRKEFEAAGFSLFGELRIPGLKENYALRFTKK